MSSVKSDTARRSRAFSAGHRLPWRPHGRPAGAGGATLYGSLRDAHGLEVVLYRALKAFGQIIKSLFILRYLDDLVLRQAVEQQLSRVELANRFTRDVAVGSPREFLQAEKEDQEIAEACNRLIRNSIVCWNYLYLEHKLATLRDAGQKLGQVHRWLAEHRRAPARILHTSGGTDHPPPGRCRPDPAVHPPCPRRRGWRGCSSNPQRGCRRPMQPW